MYTFPALNLEEWQPTLASLQTYAKVVGKVRRALTPRQKHWWHVSLQVATTGLTTGIIPYEERVFDLTLDLASHKLIITTSDDEQWHKPLTGQSAKQFCEQTLNALNGMNITVEIDQSLFADDSPNLYEPESVARYWQALHQINSIFTEFKGSLRQETGPVVLWPHHIDLAMLWFSGRLIPGQDPTNEEYSDEQVNFGFTPGDETIAQPYFYITAYPFPDGLIDTPLPEGAYWLTEGFTGAILPYKVLVTTPDPKQTLLTYLQTVQQAAASHMI